MVRMPHRHPGRGLCGDIGLTTARYEPLTLSRPIAPLLRVKSTASDELVDAASLSNPVLRIVESRWIPGSPPSAVSTPVATRVRCNVRR